VVAENSDSNCAKHKTKAKKDISEIKNSSQIAKIK
jgi:hypothetical protein